MRLICVAAIAGVLLAPQPARADAFVNPWAGLFLGEDAYSFGSFGVSFGDAGGSMWGSETNIGISPAYFGSGVENYVLDIMAGVTVGPVISPRYYPTVRPHFILDMGTIRTSIDAENATDKFSRNDVGVCVGGGVTIDFSHRLGIRGDVRYYRALTGDNVPNSLKVNLEDFHFWRLGIGFTLH